jgi:hypothetical protein
MVKPLDAPVSGVHLSFPVAFPFPFKLKYRSVLSNYDDIRLRHSILYETYGKMTFHPDFLPDLSGKVYIVTGGTAGMFVPLPQNALKSFHN